MSRCSVLGIFSGDCSNFRRGVVGCNVSGECVD